MSAKNNGGPAFPFVQPASVNGMRVANTWDIVQGMSLRDYFAAAALANSAICTGKAEAWELREWFGDRSGVTRQEITAAQACSYADAMLWKLSR